MEAYFIAQILMFAGNFSPRGWAFCNGQLLSIAQNDALFALIGTIYGGDGQTTFALPDLRGRIPVGAGQGPGLSNMVLGQVSGTQTVTLTVQQIPAHTHAPTIAVGVSSQSGNTGNPAGNVVGHTPVNFYAPAANATETFAGSTATTTPSGGNQPFNNIMPILGMNFVIALEGIFPSRN